MDYFDIRKKDGNMMSCVKAVPEDPKGIVIAIHGFSSSRDCPTYQMLLRRMPEAGLGVVGIELPGHGQAASLKEELRIEGCKNSIEAAEKYVSENLPGLPVYYFASSFGAYITGLYISSRTHLGEKAFFRSAAVNMRDLFIKEDPSEKELERLAELKEKGYFDTNMDIGRPVRITLGMFEDFRESDLFELFDPDRFGKTAVMMVHGAEDAVIDPGAARRFSDKFGVPLRLVTGEGHSLSNDPAMPDRVADLAISFYQK